MTRSLDHYRTRRAAAGKNELSVAIAFWMAFLSPIAFWGVVLAVLL